MKDKATPSGVRLQGYRDSIAFHKEVLPTCKLPAPFQKNVNFNLNKEDQFLVLGGIYSEEHLMERGLVSPWSALGSSSKSSTAGGALIDEEKRL